MAEMQEVVELLTEIRDLLAAQKPIGHHIQNTAGQTTVTGD